jgi:hypothetical protein
MSTYWTYLYTTFFNNSLIKKGRGKWPNDALTTCFDLKKNRSKVPTPTMAKVMER